MMILSCQTQNTTLTAICFAVQFEEEVPIVHCKLLAQAEQRPDPSYETKGVPSNDPIVFLHHFTGILTLMLFTEFMLS